MSADFLLKVAEVLEESAKVFDAHEAEKSAAVKNARESAAKAVAAKYTEATGEELPEDVLSKLASSDDDVLSAVQKLVEKTGSNTVESMGRSSEQSTSKPVGNKKEAAQAAWDSFGNFINS